MGLNDIVQALGNGFFPIVACGFMFYQNSKLQETLVSIEKTMAVLTEKITEIEHDLDKSKGDQNGI